MCLNSKMIFLQCLLLSSVTIWVFVAVAGLVCAILGIMACAKWGCYYCLANPLWDCLKVFWEQLKRFFWFIVRILKTMLFYASLVVTTIVYTFACCICFVVIQEWPWVRAYRDVSAKFHRREIPACCHGKVDVQYHS